VIGLLDHRPMNSDTWYKFSDAGLRKPGFVKQFSTLTNHRTAAVP